MGETEGLIIYVQYASSGLIYTIYDSCVASGQ